jgi:ribosomal protein S18 acetylase RimI-like enzyme
MTEFEWSVEDSPTEADVQRIANGVLAHGRILSRSDARPIACFIRAGGELLGGACGKTEFNRVFITYLWVEPSLRQQGLGSELLRRLEASAALRGCSDALIETLSDEVAGLYRRLGYAPLATIPNYVGVFTRHILRKSIAVTGGVQSVSP